jgi:hypothetical protein
MKLRLLLSVLFCAFLVSAYSQITTVGLIGDATPGGWDTDTDMTQDGTNPDLWTLEVTLTAGAVKFRAENDWAINWGSTDFPTGVGTQDGPNIPVFAGDYFVTFNSATGEYSFAVESPIGIIGDATPGGWDNDTNMYKDTTANGYFIILDLVPGSAKFRQDDDWAINWGSADFPSGIGTQDGANIPVPAAGTYYITFDSGTGEYNFAEQITYGTIGLIGSATPGGWDTDTPMNKDPNNPDIWRVDVELIDGEAKFRADNDWVYNWGSTDWPSGIGLPGGPNIPVVAGKYRVTLNTATGEYSFIELIEYSTIGIIGSATPGGWDEDTDMDQDPNNADVWKKRLILLDGEAKFRAENDWAYNWGAGDFPSGTATQDGANIPVVAGEYNITFNTFTGEYVFAELIIFGTVGIIGPATPLANWDEDVNMNKNAQDENLWQLNSVVMTDGEAKFRAEDAWAVNWGATDWPAGTGTQDGPNIPVVGGTYGVSINTASGEYAFGDPVSTHEQVLDPATIKVFPNPAKDRLNVDLSTLNLKGQVNFTVIDLQGKEIMHMTQDAANVMDLNVATLPTGNYMLRIQSGRYIIGKQFSIAK